MTESAAAAMMACLHLNMRSGISSNSLRHGHRTISPVNNIVSLVNLTSLLLLLVMAALTGSHHQMPGLHTSHLPTTSQQQLQLQGVVTLSVPPVQSS